ncbi:MAG: hypothetical protein ACJ8R9_08775 [Steroidobacteraceae bacterium]
MKTLSDVFAAINALEKGFPVNAWRSGDIDLWPTYRFRLHSNAVDRLLQNVPAGTSGSALRRVAARVSRALCRVPYAKLRDRRHNARVRPGASAVFFSDGISFVQLGDAWFDRVIDPVIQALEKRGHRSLKLTELSEVHIPRCVPSRFIQPALDRVKMTATWRKPGMAIPEFAAFYETARQSFGDLVPSWQWLRVQAARLHALSEWFGHILARSGGSHAFVNTYYSLEGLAFVQAARRRGMRSVDLQHGIQGPYHIAYSRWGAPPACGYSNLPDEFWVWGSEEAAAIEAWHSNCATHIARISGDFWKQRWRADSDPLIADYLEQARALRGPGTQALVCLSWGLPEQETEKLIKAAKLCKQSTSFWWRLHPVMASRSDEFARRLRQHGLDDTRVRQATQMPLFALLRAADLTLAHSSTTLREAAEFGVPSVVTSDFGAEFHSELVRSGALLHATDAGSIAAAVQSITARKAGTGEATRVDRDCLEELLDLAFPARSLLVPPQAAAL